MGVIHGISRFFAFGGNGPVVAAEIANLLDMSEVVVPPTPGVFSAFGLLLSDVEHEISRAWLHRLADAGPADMENAYATLKKELCEVMADEGYGQSDYSITRYADLRYAGQAHELTIETASAGGAPDLAALALEFGAEHERTYGHKAEAEAVECVTLRLIARVAEDRPHARTRHPGVETARPTPGRHISDPYMVKWKLR